MRGSAVAPVFITGHGARRPPPASKPRRRAASLHTSVTGGLIADGSCDAVAGRVWEVQPDAVDKINCSRWLRD